LLEKKGEVYLEDCERQRAPLFMVMEKKKWWRKDVVLVIYHSCVGL
jgi:hypothetical protein